jgi:hypothetical protein
LGRGFDPHQPYEEFPIGIRTPSASLRRNDEPAILRVVIAAQHEVGLGQATLVRLAVGELAFIVSRWTSRKGGQAIPLS